MDYELPKGTIVVLLPDPDARISQPFDIGEVVLTENDLVFVYFRRTNSLDAYPADRLLPYQRE